MSRFFKTKKYLGSKASGTKIGRATISRFVGDEGNILVSVFKSVASKHTNAAEARDLKHIVFKLVVKFAVQGDNRMFTYNTTKDLYEASLIFVKELVHLSKLADNERLRLPDSALHSLRTLALRVVEEADILERDKMSPKNMELMHRVLRYITQPSFLAHLILGDDVNEERMAFVTALETLFGDTLEPEAPSVDEQCARVGCYHRRVMQAGSDQFYRYCHFHTEEIRKTVVHNPTFFRFIQDPEHQAVFQQFLVHHNQPGLLRFYLDVESFRQLSNRRVTDARATVLFQKYLAPDASHKIELDPQLLAEIERKRSGDVCVHRSVYNDAQSWVGEHLQRAFEQHFLCSRHYRDYVALLTLPMSAAEVSSSSSKTSSPSLAPLDLSDDWAGSWQASRDTRVSSSLYEPPSRHKPAAESEREAAPAEAAAGPAVGTLIEF